MNKFLGFKADKILTALGVYFFSTLMGFAQQGQVYNQFFMNPYMYNPAYAGVDGHGVIFVMHKQQWTNIDGGPSIQHATYHVPMKGGVGFGATAFRETLGPLSSTAGKVSGSYLVNIDRKHYLRMGLSLGMGSRQLTLPEDAIGDPAFQGEGASYLIGDFGATYHFDHFNFGFSLPNLFSTPVVTETGSGFSEMQINPLDRILFKLNYRGHINHQLAIEPHILYRYSNVLPSQLEIATVVHVLHVAWVGGTYRQDAGFVGLVGAKVKHKFAVGAAFELGNSETNSLTGPGFEIHLGMHLGGHKEKKLSHVDHHKTWFDTDNDAMVAAAQAAEREKLAQEQAQPQNTDELSNLGAPVVPVVTQNKKSKWTIVGNDLQREAGNGETETAYGVPPVKGDGATWAISPATSSFEERDRPDGKREVEIKWVRISASGQLEENKVWTLIGEKPEVVASKVPVETKPTDTDTKTQPVEKPVTPVVTPPLTTDTRDYSEIAASGQHLEVKRGNNILELPAGIYLVGGVYDEFPEAEVASDRMFQRGYRDVKVGYVSARKHYYVILRSYPNLDRANQDKTRIGSNAGMSDVWVLQVKD